MDFLSHIDMIHNNNRLKYDIPESNRTFRSYIPIIFPAKKGNISFLIQKAALSKLLIVDGAQRVYLSDNQIINTILRMDKSDIQWFMSQFVKLYQSQGASFEFVIENEQYRYFGMENYPVAKEIMLISDTLIQVQDLVFLLNFIFAKDYCWEHMPMPRNASKQLKSRKDFSKRTLCKYISLIDFYTWRSSRSFEFLEKIGYPIQNEFLNEVPREEKMFQKTEMFDISLYL